MNKLLLAGATGLVIVALHMYAFGANKMVVPAPSSPVAMSEMPSDHELLPNPEIQPKASSVEPKIAMPEPKIAAPEPKMAAPVAPAGNNVPPAVNFQMQMAQITQKMFMGFAQNELMQINEAISSAFNEALTTADFDAAVSQMEGSVRSLAKAFGSNIEVDANLNGKIKTALETGAKEFDNLIRSGKTVSLSGDFYIARVMKAGFAGLKDGFAKAQIVPENTPVAPAPVAPVAKAMPAVKSVMPSTPPAMSTPPVKTEMPFASPAMPVPPVTPAKPAVPMAPSVK